MIDSQIRKIIKNKGVFPDDKSITKIMIDSQRDYKPAVNALGNPALACACV